MSKATGGEGVRRREKTKKAHLRGDDVDACSWMGSDSADAPPSQPTLAATQNAHSTCASSCLLNPRCFRGEMLYIEKRWLHNNKGSAK